MPTLAPPDPEAGPRERARGAAPGLVVALLLVAAAVVVPTLWDWNVHTHQDMSGNPVPPLHSKWSPGVGVGTLPAVVLAVLGWRYADGLARTLPWRRLLVVTYLVGLAWLFALALVDGPSGLTRVLGNPYEYLETARAVDDVPTMLSEFVSRIPYAAEDNWVTHVAGHPPGALLLFVVLDRLGLGGDLAAALVVVLVAATTAPAVLATVRRLGAEAMARRAAPFLVLGPAAVYMAVSADAVFAAVAAWGLAALAVAATRERWPGTIAWSTLAGLLLGYCVLMSYGLPLLGTIAVAVLAVARSWRPLPVAAAAACLVVLAFAAAGFHLWEAYPVLRERYWDGLASERPAAYWTWAAPAALLLSAGPFLGAGLGRVATTLRSPQEGGQRVVHWLSGAAVLTISVAVASQMSRAEVERIWLPFVPWLLLSVALLPQRWRRRGLVLQVGVALALPHLLYTSW